LNRAVLTDYHVHLRPDELDASAELYFTTANVERYRDAASAAGIGELGVSEHIHRFRDALAIWDHPFWRRYARDDLAAYCAFVREDTDLRLGLEVDFIPGREDRTASLIDACELDYAIGSVHFLGDRAVDNDDEFDVWRSGRSAEQIWRRYFETLAEAARSGLFDILAHPDLVKIWGDPHRRPDGDPRRYYEPAIEAIVDAGVAVELSTAGLRKPIAEVYPSTSFLELCLEGAVPLALSSDAHIPEQVGYAYDQALELLDSLDVREIATFSKRRRTLVALGAGG
jgi:histidinol-phosphatase (PHP family)